jgi:hypothetical protein
MAPLNPSTNVNFIKTGAGALRLLAPQSVAMNVTVQGGELRVEQGASLPGTLLRLQTGGALSLDNTAVASSDRLLSSLTVQLNGGELRLLGNATTAVNEVVNSVALGVNTSSTITLGNLAAHRRS